MSTTNHGTLDPASETSARRTTRMQARGRSNTASQRDAQRVVDPVPGSSCARGRGSRGGRGGRGRGRGRGSVQIGCDNSRQHASAPGPCASRHSGSSTASRKRRLELQAEEQRTDIKRRALQEKERAIREREQLELDMVNRRLESQLAELAGSEDTRSGTHGRNNDSISA